MSDLELKAFEEFSESLSTFAGAAASLAEVLIADIVPALKNLEDLANKAYAEAGYPYSSEIVNCFT